MQQLQQLKYNEGTIITFPCYSLQYHYAILMKPAGTGTLNPIRTNSLQSIVFKTHTQHISLTITSSNLSSWCSRRHFERLTSVQLFVLLRPSSPYHFSVTLIFLFQFSSSLSFPGLCKPIPPFYWPFPFFSFSFMLLPCLIHL